MPTKKLPSLSAPIPITPGQTYRVHIPRADENAPATFATSDGKVLFSTLPWYCDSCNVAAPGTDGPDGPGTAKPEGWFTVYTTKKSATPWGTCCKACTQKITRKGGRGEP